MQNWGHKNEKITLTADYTGFSVVSVTVLYRVKLWLILKVEIHVHNSLVGEVMV